ncbi:hypothetical protein HN51_067171, partial [Arachis hypogaea]
MSSSMKYIKDRKTKGSNCKQVFNNHSMKGKGAFIALLLLACMAFLLSSATQQSKVVKGATATRRLLREQELVLEEEEEEEFQVNVSSLQVLDFNVKKAKAEINQRLE